MAYHAYGSLKEIISPKSFTFIPANCDRVLTYKESMNINFRTERILEIQFYMLATKNHQFLDEEAMEKILTMARWRKFIPGNDIRSLYIQSMKQPKYKDFFKELERDSKFKIRVLENR